MKIHLHTDSHTEGGAALAEHVESVVEGALGRFGSQISRVEVHLSDANAGKTGSGDKHCTMEARMDGRPPQAVKDSADSVHEAINGAARKLQRVLDSLQGRLGH